MECVGLSCDGVNESILQEAVDDFQEVEIPAARRGSHWATKVHVDDFQRFGRLWEQARERLSVHLGEVTDATFHIFDGEVGKGFLQVLKAGVT